MQSLVHKDLGILAALYKEAQILTHTHPPRIIQPTKTTQAARDKYSPNKERSQKMPWLYSRFFVKITF